MVDKIEMRAMLATACHEGVMDNRMVKNGRIGFTKCWFFIKSEVQQEKQELKKV